MKSSPTSEKYRIKSKAENRIKAGREEGAVKARCRKYRKIGNRLAAARLLLSGATEYTRRPVTRGRGHGIDPDPQIRQTRRDIEIARLAL